VLNSDGSVKHKGLDNHAMGTIFKVIIVGIIDKILAEKPELEGEFEAIENEAVLRLAL
jgi:hypothetical protein